MSLVLGRLGGGLGRMLGSIARLPEGGEPVPTFWAGLSSSLIPIRAQGSSTPTFTRATTAFIEDWEDLLKPVLSGEARFWGARRVYNALLNTETVFSTNGSVVATGSQSDPNGGTGATKLVFSATGLGTYGAKGSAIVLAADYATDSVWLKGNAGGESIILWDGWAAVATLTLTTSWKRYSFTKTGVPSTGIYLSANSGTPTIFAAFPQAEIVTGQSNQNPSEYVSVGVLAAPYHGAGVDGVKYFSTLNGNTVASNVVTEASGAAINPTNGGSSSVCDAYGPFGYLAEGARTNRCLYSQVFSNAAWVSGGGGIAVTDNSIAAPDGTTTADTLTASGANGTLIQDLGVVASAAKAGGLWLKRKTGTGDIDITLDGGLTWTTVAVTSTWTRFEKTQTLADEDFGIRIVTSGDAVYAWQAQVETAAFLSTMIPTTTAAVTRNADVLTYAAAGNVLSAEGSWYYEFKSNSWANSSSKWALSFENGLGSPASLVQSGTSLSGVQGFDGTNTANGPAGTPSGLMKHAGYYSAATSLQQVFANGSAGASGRPFDGSMNVGTTLTIGALGGGTNQADGTTRNVRIYGRALSAAKFQAMTA